MWGWDWTAFGAGASLIAAIGTVLAFFIGWKQLDTERRNRKEDLQRIEDKEARVQAEQVAAWCDVRAYTEGRSELTVIARNGSELPIYLVTVVLVRFKGTGAERGEDVVANAPALSSKDVFPHIPPGDASKDMCVSPALEGSRVGVEIAFLDAAGRSWVRRGDGELQSLGKQDPRIDRVSDASAIAGELYHPEEQ